PKPNFFILLLQSKIGDWSPSQSPKTPLVAATHGDFFDLLFCAHSFNKAARFVHKLVTTSGYS
ncbi:hypothetical protein, partial [Lacticaseibacillus saniviri]|uniref:hypothetical protein n=1 Tax=Lacticaseibacillus saniviri TaxID=931533 RepID=UPI001CDD24E0